MNGSYFIHVVEYEPKNTFLYLMRYWLGDQNQILFDKCIKSGHHYPLAIRIVWIAKLALTVPYI